MAKQARFLFTNVWQSIQRQNAKLMLGNVRLMSTDVETQFAAAKEKLNTLKEDPGNDVKLKMYALFKQATIGENKTEKPGTFNFVGQAKWKAWSSLGSMSQDEAKTEYAKIVDELKLRL